MAQDSLLRLISQMAAMLESILAQRRAGRRNEAAQEIEALVLQRVGLPLPTILRMPPAAVAEHLAGAGANRFTRAVALAELLMQNGELLEEEGQLPGAIVSELHAFCLLFDALEVLSVDEQAVYRPKLGKLAEKLERLPPNPFISEKLAAYRAGRTSPS